MIRLAAVPLLALPLAALAAPVPKSVAEIKDFGTVVDPDRDCTFDSADGKLRITIPPAFHVLTISLEKQNAPRVLREVEGDFSASVRLAAEFPADVKSDIKDAEPAVAAGLVVWGDDENYVCLERAHELLGRKRASSFELHYIDAGQDGGESGPPSPFAAEPVYLRVTRTGGKVAGEMSEDGESWKPTALIEMKKLPKKVKVGVFAEHSTGKKVTATFDKFAVKPAGGLKKSSRAPSADPFRRGVSCDRNG